MIRLVAVLRQEIFSHIFPSTGWGQWEDALILLGGPELSTRLDHIQGAPAACLHPTLGFATLQLCNLVWLSVWGLLAGRSQWVADWYQWLQYCWTGVIMEKEGGQLIDVSQIHQTDILPGILFLPFCVASHTFCHFNFWFPIYCLLKTQVSLIPASPSGSISGPPFTALQPGAGNKIQVATVSQRNHAPEYQVQLSCSNYFTTAGIRLTMAEKISSFTRIV